MKAIILARVSTEEQMTEGQSIPAQLARAQEYVKKFNLEVVSEYQFDESSIKDKRLKFDQVIDEIKKSKDKIALITETVDRLQRSFKESVMLDELRKLDKLELHFIREGLVIHKNSNSSEIQRWDLAVFVAKSYVLQVRDNVNRTIKQKIQIGEFPCRAPIGYINTDDGSNKRTIIVDPIKSIYVIKVFELYATGSYSMKRVANMLNEANITGNMGGKFKVRQVELILNNPFYYGYMNFKGEILPHKYPPLISYDLFNKCLSVREGYTKKPRKHSIKPFIFSGLMTCQRCGCTITPEFHKGRYVYYHCTNYHGNCEKIWVTESEILKPIREVLKNIQLPQNKIDKVVESLRTTNESKNKFQTQELSSLRNEYDNLEKRISKMYDDHLDDKIDLVMYNKKLKEYKERQAEVLFKTNQFKNASESFYITAGIVLSLARRAEEIFESSEVEEKRQLLNFLFLNLKLDGKKLEYKLKAPFDGVLSTDSRHVMGAQRELNSR